MKRAVMIAFLMTLTGCSIPTNQQSVSGSQNTSSVPKNQRIEHRISGAGRDLDRQRAELRKEDGNDAVRFEIWNIHQKSPVWQSGYIDKRDDLQHLPFEARYQLYKRKTLDLLRKLDGENHTPLHYVKTGGV